MTDRAFACHVCGKGMPETLYRQNRTGKPGIWACEAHIRRIRCIIEGCSRIHDGNRGSEWICSAHWRRYCPPRSKRRRAYLSFFREAKRRATPANPTGWDDDLAARYWRFWDTLVASAQARDNAGRVDMTEINRLFGWTDGEEM